ncbi:MAG: heparinase II/III domain-containing protein, partial [Candidatus Dormibacteria bacterium]
VLGKVPGHPRILLSAERIHQLRSGSEASDLLELVHRKAGEVRAKIQYNPAVGSNIARLSTVSVFPDLPEYFNVMESYSQVIALSALEYSLSGSPEALDAARHALLTVSAWSTWTPPWFAAHGLHTYYEVGVFTQRVAFGYDMIADHMTSTERAQVADAFWRNSVNPTLEEYFFLDRMPIAASNHMANSVGGAIAACVALYGDVPDWESRFGPALAELITAHERLMNGLFPGDGSEAEPAGYEDFAMEGMSWGEAALDALGIRPSGSERMMQGFWWLRYAEFTPVMFLDTGDFGTSLSALSGFAWTAENSHDPALLAFYQTAADQSLAGVLRVQHTGRALEAAPGLLDLACCTQLLENRAEPPLSRIFASRGSAALRSGWRPEDTVVSIRVGPWFNHEHHDQGSFRVAAYGEELIGEAGYTDYYKDPHYADYFTQVPAHNAVVIDGDAFSQGYYDGRYWTALHRFPSITRHLFSSDFDYVSANLAPAYAGLSTYNREYIFIKPDVLIVHDRLRASSPHRYTWFLHAPVGTNAEADANQAIIRGENAIASIVAAGPANRWAMEEAPTSQNAMGDLDRGKIEPREVFHLDSPWEKEAEFLVGMRFEKSNEGPETLRVLRGTSSEGFELPNGAALFRTGAGFLTIQGISGGEITAAADIVAAREIGGKLEIFLSQARSLRQGNHLLLSSNTPVDAILHADSAGLDLKINCATVTNVQVFEEKRPATVTLDQASIPFPSMRGFIALNRLSQGEHIVRITY